MRIKKITAFLCAALAMLMTGCSTQTTAEEQEGVRPVYYLQKGEKGRKLSYEVMEFDEDRPLKEKIHTVIDAMREPLNENDVPLIAKDMRVTDVQVFGSTVVVRFSENYDRLPPIEKSLVASGVSLSLTAIDKISYVRVSGEATENAVFRSANSVLLDDEDLRLSSFNIEVYPVNRAKDELFGYQLTIVTEKEEITPNIVLTEMVNGQLGSSAPFDGRMDVRTVSGISGSGAVRAELYVPVEMELQGRETDVYSIVNSICSCRGVETVTITINGRPPSDRGLVGCDGPLKADTSYIGEENVRK